METCYLLDVKTNIKSLIYSSLVGEESVDQWFDDFEDTLKNLTPTEAVFKYNEHLFNIKVSLSQCEVTFQLIGEEESIRQLQKNHEMQRKCVERIREILYFYNEALLDEYIARIPNAYTIWKNNKFYVEIASNQNSLDIEFDTIEFEEDVYEDDIEWEYLL